MFSAIPVILAAVETGIKSSKNSYSSLSFDKTSGVNWSSPFFKGCATNFAIALSGLSSTNFFILSPRIPLPEDVIDFERSTAAVGLNFFSGGLAVKYWSNSFKFF